jgi:hypothetical protein
MHFPYEWVPYTVEVQILRVGQLAILSVPGELTTMAGRRLKRAVRSVVRAARGGGRLAALPHAAQPCPAQPCPAPPSLLLWLLLLLLLLLLLSCRDLPGRAGSCARACVRADVLAPRLWSQVEEAWGPGLQLVIAGLTNTYSSYVTTWEEYQAQRYEGGFTLFGPHTLDAYIQVRRGFVGKRDEKMPSMAAGEDARYEAVAV